MPNETHQVRPAAQRTARLRRYAPFAIGVVMTAIALVACSTLDREVVAPPDIPGARFVGNQTCYDCHTNYVRAFPFSPHARLHVVTAQMPANSGCESCHGPGSLHVAAGGGRGKLIVNPGRDPQACFTCHLETHAQFKLPQHHPVPEGQMNCVQCHDPHGFDIMKPARGLAMSRVNESCAECHREQTRPMVFEHPAMREGCIACHQPHGSINKKLLTQPDQNMCLRCHAQVAGPGVARGRLVIGKTDHSTFVNRGTCWTSSCHTSVHGSNVHPYFLY